MEISRLKDIGQSRPCSPRPLTKSAFHAMGMSLMPYFLRAILMAADGR